MARRADLSGHHGRDGSAGIDIDIDDNELIRDVEYLDKTSTVTLHATSALVELSASAYLKSYAAQSETGSTAYAFATASLQYTTSFEAPEICGIAAGSAIYHSPLRGWDDGGVAMERWEDP